MSTAQPRYLLDTNILVAYIRANALGRYVEETYGLQSSPFRPLICVVTVGEIRVLAAKWGWGEKKVQRMGKLLHELVWVDIGEPEVLDAYVCVDTSRPSGIEIPQNESTRRRWALEGRARWPGSHRASNMAVGGGLCPATVDPPPHAPPVLLISLRLRPRPRASSLGEARSS